MAPHRDDRSSTPADERLRSLYTQRKASHRAPDALNQAVLERARAHNRPGRWTRVVPSVAAAFVVMALGLQWLSDPAVTVLEERAARPATEQAPPMEIMSAPDSAGQPREHTLSFEAEPRIQKPASAPSPQKSVPEASALSDSAGDRMLAEPLEEAETAPMPRYLRVVPSENGVFEHCDGTRFQRAIEQAPEEGWFELTWTDDRIERITPLPESPCEPDTP
ncbi:hypothetical protein [Saccharospirillum salsuginis]|uniref:Uncharacterized protein n=1 Tax=Saccharospirillum salsuginis TaxID=418750 RepID=A0A918K9N4_9GAMM|nr:hypothetical protein [Saccharospirillum salsuginis]GGX53972.1 hypothetical protein GCM10007392_21610 [Saccharospirillum salsuginis]